VISLCKVQSARGHEPLHFCGTAVGQKLNEVGAFLTPCTISFSDGHNQLGELFLARKLQKFLANLFPFNVSGGIVISRSGFNGNVQDQFESTTVLLNADGLAVFPKANGPRKAIGFGT